LLKLVGLLHLQRFLPAPLLWWMVFAATVGIAYLAWILLERPLQNVMKFGPRPVAAPA
jgi:peptidoglycan/LPS O-acetylase OafA/YrhL